MRTLYDLSYPTNLPSSIDETSANKTLAVVGAGPGLGYSIAKRFGAIDVVEFSPVPSAAPVAAADGIFAAHVALDLFIDPGAGEADPDALAERFFELAERRDQPEIKVGNYIEQGLANACA